MWFLGFSDFVTFGILYFGAFLDSPYPPPGSSFFGVFGDFGVCGVFYILGSRVSWVSVSVDPL